MKLAAHLQPGARPVTRLASEGGSGTKRKLHMLYIFDEPTTGLHFDDVSKLLSAFRRLIDAGGSIVVIEHNLEVIKRRTGSSTLARKAAIAAGTWSARGRRRRSRN